MNSLGPVSAEVGKQIQILLFPSGDRQFQHTRDDAIVYLLAHANESYTQLLALLEGDSPPVLVIDLIWRFARAESIPVLEKILRDSSDIASVAAAQALARHPDPEAGTVLERALTDPSDQVVASAVAGLLLRGGEQSCTALKAALSHKNFEIRSRIEAAIDSICKKTITDVKI